jgi:hypothetical protein
MFAARRLHCCRERTAHGGNFVFNAHSAHVTREADRSVMKQIGRCLVISTALIYGQRASADCTASLQLLKYDDDRMLGKATGTASSCPNNNDIDMSVSYDGGPFVHLKECFASPCEGQFDSGYACLKDTHTLIPTAWSRT